MSRNGAPGDAAVPAVPGRANAVVPLGGSENQTARGLTPAGAAPVITVPDGVEYVDSGPDAEGAEYSEMLATLPFRYRAGLGRFEE